MTRKERGFRRSSRFRPITESWARIEQVRDCHFSPHLWRKVESYLMLRLDGATVAGVVAATGGSVLVCRFFVYLYGLIWREASHE